MGRAWQHIIFLLYLVYVLVISADAADKHLNIWPMPKSVSYGHGNLYLSNYFELETKGSKFVDASGILKDAFLRTVDVVRSVHVIEVNTSKIDPSIVLKGIHIVVLSPSDEVPLAARLLGQSMAFSISLLSMNFKLTISYKGS